MNTNRARQWQESYVSSHAPREHQTQVKVKVKKASWITKGEKIIYSTISLCLIIAGLFIVSYSSSTDDLNRNIQSLEQTINDQYRQIENLQFEVKELSEPERIIKIAEENGLKIQDTKVKRAQSMNN